MFLRAWKVICRLPLIVHHRSLQRGKSNNDAQIFRFAARGLISIVETVLKVVYDSSLNDFPLPNKSHIIITLSSGFG